MFKKLTFKIIRFYQNFFSPSLGKNCRFYPSCSKYAYRAIERYGLLGGGWKGFKRILKCHPWHSGGVDLP
jgi:hypothetical protein